MELVRTPLDMDELHDLIKDMRGSQSDLARVAIMGQAIGHREGWDAAHNEIVAIVKTHQTEPLFTR